LASIDRGVTYLGVSQLQFVGFLGVKFNVPYLEEKYTVEKPTKAKRQKKVKLRMAINQNSIEKSFRCLKKSMIVSIKPPRAFFAVG